MTEADMMRHLQAALTAQDKRPLWTIEDVLTDIVSGEAKLWTGRKSCVVTVESDYPRAGEKIIEGWLAGGDLEEIAAMTTMLERYGKDRGCTQAHITGRPGWVKAFAGKGYEHYGTIIRKLL